MLLQKFDYQQICRLNNGDKKLALSKMTKSFNFYYKKRNNFVARSRAKSALKIIKKLKEGIIRRDTIKTSKVCRA